jgi:hypothetical protein
MVVAYARDTEVADVDEPRPRRITWDFVVHVMHSGLWHRRLPDMSATACGERYHSQFAPVRREVLEHPLCPGCFVPLELARADAADVEKYEP